ncbi:MAG: hypothetical protein JWM11_10 [Planctomycetaceae bacterium]|nr:hypothetical protein [Planctomycetaceae bacterium]
MKKYTLMIVFVVFSGACSGLLRGDPPAPKAVPKKTLPEINEARRTGWQLASLIIARLEADDQKNFPGIQAWLKDYRQIAKGIDLKLAPDQWPVINVDALTIRNGNFWQAYYEIAPGDPGLMLLHSGLLLSAGEANRAQYLLVIAGQRPGIPKEFRQAFDIILAQTQKIREKPNGLVMEGIKLFDKADFAGALKKYQAALELWPQNGFALYEAGMTVRDLQRVAAGEKPLPPSAVMIDNKIKNSAEVTALFAKSRRHDPFQINSYQGDDKEVIRRFLVLGKKVLPAWQNLAKNQNKQVDDALLEQFAGACQEASLDDLALVTRQILIARRINYAPADHQFIGKSLNKLVPGKQIDGVLSRLATGKLELRQLVVPEPVAP